MTIASNNNEDPKTHQVRQAKRKSCIQDTLGFSRKKEAKGSKKIYQIKSIL